MERRHLIDTVTAVFGSVSGSLLAGWLGLELGRWYVRWFMPFAELEGVFPLAVGLLGGVWIGAVLGCWLALRIRRPAAARRAATTLGLVYPLGGAGWFVLSALLRSSSSRTGADDLLLYGSGLALHVGATVLACWLTFRARSHPGDDG